MPKGRPYRCRRSGTAKEIQLLPNRLTVLKDSGFPSVEIQVGKFPNGLSGQYSLLFQETENSLLGPEVLIARPPPMLSSWDANKLVWDSGPVQSFMQPNAVLVRHS